MPVLQYEDVLRVANCTAQSEIHLFNDLSEIRCGRSHTCGWVAEEDGRLQIFTNPNSGKVKRMRNNPAVSVAPCTIRGRVTGPEFSGRVRFLPPEQAAAARKLLEKKYWLMKVPFLWSKDNVLLEIELV